MIMPAVVSMASHATTVYLMAACSDASFTLRSLVLPALNSVPYAGVNIEIIGQPNPDAPYGVRCMHGDTECYGGMAMLCAQGAATNSLQSVNFATTLSEALVASLPDDPTSIDAQITASAEEAGLDPRAILQCIQTNGPRLLRESIDRTFLRSVSKSATVHIHNDHWIIRDRGRWQDWIYGTVSDTEHVFKRFIQDLTCGRK